MWPSVNLLWPLAKGIMDTDRLSSVRRFRLDHYLSSGRYRVVPGRSNNRVDVPSGCSPCFSKKGLCPMANQTHSQMVKVCDTFSHKDFNVSRMSGDYGSESELKKLQASLVRDGWREDANGTLLAVVITDEWKAKAVEVLTARWEELKEKVKTDSKVQSLLTVFEANRVKGTKVIVPKFMLDSGNRRNSVLDAANVDRYEAKQPLIQEFPIIVRHFGSEIERIVAQMLDNTGKKEGFALPSEKDMLLCGQVILQKGGIQDDIRKAFGATTGQKIYGILTLNNLFPTVNLLNRIIATDPKDPTFLRYGPIKGPALPNLVKRATPTELAKENDKRITAGLEVVKPLTAEDLETFLGSKTINLPKIMERKNIEALSQNSPVNIGKAFAKSVVDNNTDGLNKYIAHAGVYNAVETLCDKGIGPDLEAILVSLTRAQDLGVAVKSIKAAVKV